MIDIKKKFKLVVVDDTQSNIDAIVGVVKNFKIKNIYIDIVEKVIGEDALKYYIEQNKEKNDGNIDMIITDYHMGAMNGCILC